MPVNFNQLLDDFTQMVTADNVTETKELFKYDDMVVGGEVVGSENTELDGFKKYLKQGVKIMKYANFGRNERVFLDMYNKNNWLPGDNHNLILKEGVLPSKSISEIFNSPSDWMFDCAEFVQLVFLYALLKSLGNAEFDAYINLCIDDRSKYTFVPHDFNLYQYQIPGVETDIAYNFDYSSRKFYRETWLERIDFNWQPPLVDEDAETLIKNAPIGSRILFTNKKASSDFAFKNENTIKIGNNLFGAHSLVEDKNTFSYNQIKKYLAKYTYTYIDGDFAKYVSQNIYVRQIEYYKIP